MQEMTCALTNTCSRRHKMGYPIWNPHTLCRRIWNSNQNQCVKSFQIYWDNFQKMCVPDSDKIFEIRSRKNPLKRISAGMRQKRVRDGFKTQPPVDRRFCRVPAGFYYSKQWQPPGTGRNQWLTSGWVLKSPLTFCGSNRNGTLYRNLPQYFNRNWTLNWQFFPAGFNIQFNWNFWIGAFFHRGCVDLICIAQSTDMRVWVQIWFVLMWLTSKQTNYFSCVCQQVVSDIWGKLSAL